MTKSVSQYPLYVLGAGYWLRVDRNLKLEIRNWMPLGIDALVKSATPFHLVKI